MLREGFYRRCGSRLVLAWLVFGLVPSMASAVIDAPPPVVNPVTCHSPSGEFSFSIDPTDLHGEGAGKYSLKRNGEEVWSGQRPWTLQHAEVTDAGLVAGAASVGSAWDGEVHVVLIDLTGTTVLDHVTPRDFRYIHSPAYPLPVGLWIDVASDRLVVRTNDPQHLEGPEVWWNYSISRRKFLSKFVPESLLIDPKTVWDCRAVTPVPGTPLVLVEWSTGVPETADGRGARIALIHSQGTLVWQLDLPEDSVRGATTAADEELLTDIQEQRAILGTSEPGKFVLRFARDKQRVDFEITRDPAGRWIVTEADRQPFVPALPPPRPPHLELAHLGTIKLESPVPVRPSEVRDVSKFVSDDRGRIVFLRAPVGQSPALVVVDSQGKLLRVLALKSSGTATRAGWAGLTWAGGDTFLLQRDTGDELPRVEVWRSDVSSGKATLIPGVTCSTSSTIAAEPTGDFYFLGGLLYFKGGFTGDDTLTAFGADAQQRWQLTRGVNSDDPATLSGTNGLTLTTDGRLAVLDGIRNLVQFFDRDGTFLRSIDLTISLGEEPGYLSGISADVDGGVILHDSPLVRVTAEGQVKSRIEPAYADGRRLTVAGVQVSPDGRLWCTDGDVIARLTDEGIVDRLLGNPPDPRQLEEIQSLTLGPEDRIYVESVRTGAVHVFDRNGAWQRVCIPGVEGINHFTVFAVTEAGDVYLPIDDGVDFRTQFLHFAPDGTRLGIESVGVDRISERWLFQPDSRRRWVIGYHEVYLLGEDGSVLKTISCDAHRDWLAYVEWAEQAPDGSLAVLSQREGLFATETWRMTIFSKDGEPLTTWSLPTRSLRWSPKFAYDGTLLAIVSGPEIVFCDTHGAALGATRLEGDHDSWGVPFLPRTVAELWLYDGKCTLQRYELPVKR